MRLHASSACMFVLVHVGFLQTLSLFYMSQCVLHISSSFMTMTLFLTFACALLILGRTPVSPPTWPHDRMNHPGAAFDTKSVGPIQ